MCVGGKEGRKALVTGAALSFEAERVFQRSVKYRRKTSGRAKFRCCNVRSVRYSGVRLLCTHRVVTAGSVAFCTELCGRKQRPSMLFNFFITQALASLNI